MSGSYDAKDPIEEDFFTMDFLYNLSEDETIESVVVTCENLGVNQPDMIKGFPAIVADKVTIVIVGGIDGKEYLLRFVANTSLERVVALSGTFSVKVGA